MSSLYCLLVCNGSLFHTSGQQYMSLTNHNQQPQSMFISYCLVHSSRHCALDLECTAISLGEWGGFKFNSCTVQRPTVQLRGGGGFIAPADPFILCSSQISLISHVFFYLFKDLLFKHLTNAL